MRKFLLLILIFCTNITAQKSWTLKECVERALEKNISIKQTELNFTEAELNKKNAIGNFIPNFNIGSSHSWNVGLNQDITTGILENITTQFTSMNLNVNVDVLNGLKNIKQLHLANLNILSNKFQLEDMKENVSLLVANSFLQILFNKELLKVQKIQYDLSIEDLSRAQELVENGVLPVGDLYEIEANKSSAEKSLIDAENALTLAKLALAQLILIENYQNFDGSVNIPKVLQTYMGGKKKIDVARIKELKSEGLGATAIAKEMGIHRDSVYRLLKAEVAS